MTNRSTHASEKTHEKAPGEFIEALKLAEKSASDGFRGFEKYMPQSKVNSLRNYRVAVSILETFKQELREMVLDKKYWPALESISYGLSYIQNNQALRDRETFDALNELGYFVNIHEGADFLLGKIKRGLKRENEEKMFDWLEEQIFANQPRPNPTLTIYNSFAARNFTKKKFVKRNRQRLEEQVALFSRGPGLEPILEDTVLDLINVLEQDGEEVYEFCLRYWSLPYVRERYFRHCLDYGNYQELVQLFEDAVKNYVSTLEADVWTHQSALEAYQKLGKTAKAIEMLEWLMQNDSENLLAYYYQARNISGKNWAKDRERILPIVLGVAQNLEVYSRVDERKNLEYIFKDEGMYDELATVMAEAPFGESDETLIAAVEENLPERAVDVWLNNLRYRTVYSERKTYEWMVDVFRRMEKLPNGREAVEGLLAKWRKEYPSRKLMWKIFKEAGY